MLKSRIARIAVAAAALAVPAGTVVAFTAQPATAAFTGIKCKGVVGTTTGTIQLTNCTATSGYTGSQPFASVPAATTSLATGGTVTWTDGQTTTTGAATIATTEETDTKGACAAGSTEDAATGAVTAGFTGGGPLPGTVKLEVCVTTAGAITLEPGAKVKIN